MIDCGLVVEMGEQDHVNLVRVLGAFIKRDGNLAGQLMIDTAKKCQSTELDIELFCQGIQRICEMDEDQVSFTVFQCFSFFVQVYRQYISHSLYLF